MKTLWIAVGVACVAMSGCNKSSSSADSGSSSATVSDAAAASDSGSPAPTTTATADNAPPSGMPAGNPAAAMATQGQPATAQDFVQLAAASDMFEIASSKAALQRSNNPAVKDFARMMITDHTKTTAALKAAIAKSGQSLALPAQMPADKQAMLQDLNTTTDFNHKYMDDQVDGHQTALDLMSRYANDGTVPELKAFAGKTGVLVQKHLDKAKAVRQQLG